MMLKELRTNKGLSQRDLSNLTGISIRTLQAYEQEARNVNEASLDTLTKLALALNCTIAELLTDDTLAENLKKTL